MTTPHQDSHLTDVDLAKLADSHALTDAQRAAFLAHSAGCETCRMRVTLALMPAPTPTVRKSSGEFEGAASAANSRTDAPVSGRRSAWTPEAIASAGRPNSAATTEAHADYDELTAYVEQRLSPVRRASLQSHLSRCQTCTEEAEGLARFRTILSVTDPIAPPPNPTAGEAVARERRGPLAWLNLRGRLAPALAAQMAVIVLTALVAGRIGMHLGPSQPGTGHGDTPASPHPGPVPTLVAVASPTPAPLTTPEVHVAKGDGKPGPIKQKNHNPIRSNPGDHVAMGDGKTPPHIPGTHASPPPVVPDRRAPFPVAVASPSPFLPGQRDPGHSVVTQVGKDPLKSVFGGNGGNGGAGVKAATADAEPANGAGVAERRPLLQWTLPGTADRTVRIVGYRLHLSKVTADGNGTAPAAENALPDWQVLDPEAREGTVPAPLTRGQSYRWRVTVLQRDTDGKASTGAETGGYFHVLLPDAVERLARQHLALAETLKREAVWSDAVRAANRARALALEADTPAGQSLAKDADTLLDNLKLETPRDK